MKLFTATNLTQGQRPDDFYWCEPGEIVCFGIGKMEGDGIITCPSEAKDESCGCGRSLVGINSRKSTTTMQIVDLPLTVDLLADALFNSIEQAGFPIVRDADTVNHLRRHIRILTSEAERWQAGDVLEYRHGEFAKRELAAAV